MASPAHSDKDKNDDDEDKEKNETNGDDDDDARMPTMMMTMTIPRIDTLDDAAGFAAAMEQYGFCVLQPLSEELTAAAAALRAAALGFFRQSAADKQAYSSGGTYGPPGWAAQGLESVQRSTRRRKNESSSNDEDEDDDTFVADAVESFVYHGGAEAPPVPPVLKEPLDRYHALVNALLDQVMETTALSQGLEKDFFVPFFKNRSCAMRLAYYPAGNGTKYGAHTDYTGFTLLNTEKSGLQVFNDNDWVNIPCRSDTMIINAGDLIPVWTNGRFTSALHRVVATPELMHADRLSIVYFTGPADDVLVEPIQQNDGEALQFQPVLAGEHLRAKLASTNR